MDVPVPAHQLAPVGNRTRLLAAGEQHRAQRVALREDRMSEVSQILNSLELGDKQAANRLLPLVYEELRRLAEQRLAREAPGQTLQPTALVHEAYLRLVGSAPEQSWQGRGHFFAA